MNWRGSQTALIILFFATIAGCTASEPTSFYFPTLTINSDLHPEAHGPKEILKPPTAEYYFMFHAATGLTSINHFRRDARTGNATDLFYLETDQSPDQTLLRTVKTELLDSGRFGSLLTQTNCFFKPNYRNGAGVKVYFHSPIYEIPGELNAWPPDALPLTSVSLVRLFRMSPELVTVSANYEADGRLGSLGIDGARNGDWTNTGSDNRILPFIGGFSRLGIKPEQLARFGIPDKFDLAQYQRQHAVRLPDVSTPQEHVWVVEMFGFGRLIRVADLQDGKVARQRILRPPTRKSNRIWLPSRTPASMNSKNSESRPPTPTK